MNVSVCRLVDRVVSCWCRSAITDRPQSVCFLPVILDYYRHIVSPVPVNIIVRIGRFVYFLYVLVCVCVCFRMCEHLHFLVHVVVHASGGVM